jgi:hypothetical protein
MNFLREPLLKGSDYEVRAKAGQPPPSRSEPIDRRGSTDPPLPRNAWSNSRVALLFQVGHE